MSQVINSNIQQNTIFEKGSGDLNQLAQHGWNILKEEVSFPIAVLNEAALLNNARWMQAFSEKANVKLAPHGKTTMAPELFNLQQEFGCWGMSLATIPQVVNAYQQGSKRIILANQLIGKYHCQLLLPLLKDQNFEFYCFVDSIENVEFLGEFFSQYANENISLNVLIEVGVNGGRCGWRDADTVKELSCCIAQYKQLMLSGISFYEGVIHGDNAEIDIRQFIEQIIQTFSQIKALGHFTQQQVIITGAGSAWYDVVAEQLTQHVALNFISVIRPGCYLIHDTGIYQDAQQTVMERSQLACDIGGDLISSLSLWAYVHSVPERGLAIIGLGKRDSAFDAGLPIPELFYRPGQKKPIAAQSHWHVTKIMDQHCMMSIGENDDIQPGDLINFSTSHPCLTMDKWRKIGIVNDEYKVIKQIETFF